MIKVKKIKTSFKGVNLGKTETAGITFEQELARRGSPVQTGKGADYKAESLEVKTKSKESRSANVICTMSRSDIIKTPYAKSALREKMLQQLRVETEDGVIVKEGIYDFSKPFIQDIIQEAYEIGREKLKEEDPPDYIYCTRYGYFEKRPKTKNSYMYRINVKAMKELEDMSKSTFENWFK